MVPSRAMNWITDTIAIGNYLEARDTALHRRHGIRSVLCLDGSLEGHDPALLDLADIEVFALVDGPGNLPMQFFQAVSLVAQMSQATPNLLVHCHAGRSRSAVVVAGHLMCTRGLSPADAIGYVAARREINLTPGIESLLGDRRLRP